MLYHFPNESPKELEEQDRLRLQREIKNARRVETEGYRKKECSLQSFYIEYRCIQKYLQCEITKWKLPKSSKDKIEVELLPTEFLSPRDFYKPLYFHDPVLNEKVRRIVGYREILQKREYVEYLKEVETSYGVADDDMFDGNVSSEDKHEDDYDLENADEDEAVEWRKCLEVARGGSKAKKEKKEGTGKKGQGKGHEKGKGKSKGKGKKKKDDKGAADPKVITRTERTSIRRSGVAPDPAEAARARRQSMVPDFEDITGIRQDNEDHGFMRRISAFFGVDEAAQMKKKELQRTAAQLEKEHKQNLEEIFKYHGQFRVPARTEKDNEWLELSYSDKEEEMQEVTSFEKDLLPWMRPGLSFESQYLVHTLRPFLTSLSITGRSFLATKPDLEKKHIDFMHRRRDLIVFFLTSFFFWVCFVMMTVAVLDIQWENQHHVVTKSSTVLVTLEDMQQKAQQAQHEVEELELNKYKIPITLVMINLTLTAIWSLLMILGDGIYVAHYFNCWTAALAEMETSGCLGIRKKIWLHHLYFLFYVAIYSLGFAFDYPEHIRHFSGEMTVMVLRAFKRTIRIQKESALLPYQIAGLCLIVYIVYSSSMIKLIMQILAMILKNASEMWNFKFALTFEQLVSRNRAQVIKLSLKHSLIKLFTHHRILTVLLRNFGEVFSIQIMIYMVCEMGVLTLIMVELFFYKAGSPDQYGGAANVTIKSKSSDRDKETTLYINYYHPPIQDYVMMMLILTQVLFQYIGTTEILSKAGASFYAGYEFVRRCGTVLCKGSHQRRLIQSLEWSFSSTNPSVLSANGYFTVNREAILSAFGAVIGFFSLIIQLQVASTYGKIEFLEWEDCKKIKDHILVNGACEMKETDQLEDNSLNFTRISTTTPSS